MTLLKNKLKLLFIASLIIILPHQSNKLLADSYPTEKISIENFKVNKSILNFISEKEFSKIVNEEEYIPYSTDVDSSEFDFVQMIIENNETKKYPIRVLQGLIGFSNTQKCLNKKDNIIKNISPSLTSGTLRKDDQGEAENGKIKIYRTQIFLETGDLIKIQCVDLDQQFKEKTGQFEGLLFNINTREYLEKNYPNRQY